MAVATALRPVQLQKRLQMLRQYSGDKCWRLSLQRCSSFSVASISFLTAAYSWLAMMGDFCSAAQSSSRRMTIAGTETLEGEGRREGKSWRFLGARRYLHHDVSVISMRYTLAVVSRPILGGSEESISGRQAEAAVAAGTSIGDKKKGKKLGILDRRLYKDGNN